MVNISVATSDLVAGVSRYFASPAVSLLGLKIFRIPLRLEAIAILQACNSFDADPAHRLLRGAFI